MRLTVVTGRPVQYHAPLFRQLHGEGDLDLEVLYASSAGARLAYDPGFAEEIRWERDLLEGYPYRILERGSPDQGKPRTDQLALYRTIVDQQSDVVWIDGYTELHSWVALAGAKRAGSATIYRGQADLKLERPWHVRAVKRLVLPRLFQAYDGILYSYEANRRYFRHYGVADENLFFCPSSVDAEWLREQAEGTDRASFLRDRLSLSPERTIVLFVGKLIARKRPLDLVRAFAWAPSSENAALVFVGSGELEERIRATAKREGIADAVRITGFQPQTEVARYFSAADLLALPSELDPSPKALHEAMAFGLPVVVSDTVGTVGDLVKDGVNARVHAAGDVEELSDRLEGLLGSESWRRELGDRGRETAERWSMKRAAGGVRRAARHAATAQGGRPEPTAPTVGGRADR